MSRFLPMLFVVVVFFGMWLVMHAHQRREKEKRALPLREAYLQAHGLAEARCHACGSTELSDIGLSHGRDERRVVSCAKCGELMYRFSRASAHDIRG